MTRVGDREYVWTDTGLAYANTNRVAKQEVVDALYSPQRIEHRIGETLVSIAGLADSARVIVVVCERIANLNRYGIIRARPATPDEIKVWMEGTQ
jgi:hypothetical protein